MWHLLLDLAFDAARVMVARSGGKKTMVRPSTQRQAVVMVHEYRRWAARNGLTSNDGEATYRGRLQRHDVEIRPGLDGSAPVGVELEIAIAHGATRVVLLGPLGPRRSDPDEEPVNEADAWVGEVLSSLFRDSELASDLRSIAILEDGLRLRFRALTGPEVLADAVDAVAGALAPTTRSAPYRGPSGPAGSKPRTEMQR